MIPLRSSERIYSRTIVVATLIIVNLLVFLYQASLSVGDLNRMVTQLGIVPDTINQNLGSLATSMFLHGGWLHLLGNMWFLWVFGRLIEDSVGSGRFLILYLVCGIAAGAIHVMVNPYSRIPTIGASGAIAGVMGAYLIKFPRSYIDSLVFLLIFVTRLAIPAPFFLIYWFAMQFFSGIGSLAEVDYTGGGTAWFAHIGGFVAGMLLIRMFPDRRPKWRPWYEGE